MKLSLFFNKKKKLTRSINAMSKSRSLYLEDKISSLEYSRSLAKVMEKITKYMDYSVEMIDLARAMIQYMEVYESPGFLEKSAWLQLINY